MTKVEKLIQALEYHMDQEDEYYLNNEGHRMLEELVQAVREEELNEAKITLKSSKACRYIECENCPANGTRYCP